MSGHDTAEGPCDRILVVAVHADDETLGCGGTLLRARQLNVDTHWLIITSPPNDRREVLDKVKEQLGFKTVHLLEIPDGGVDALPKAIIISKLKQVIMEIQPTIVILPFFGDAHSDHRATFEAFHPFTKAFRYGRIRSIYLMEVPSETDIPIASSGGFIPNVFSDITGHIESKIRIMSSCYPAEVISSRNSSIVRSLASLRGSIAGCEYAEAFMLVRTDFTLRSSGSRHVDDRIGLDSAKGD